MKWEVYYDDGETITDQETDVENIRTRGVIAVVQENDRTGYTVTESYDFYKWMGESKGWYGCDHFGLWDYLTRDGMKKVLFGRSVPDEIYESIINRAHDSEYMPDKSGRHPRVER